MRQLILGTVLALAPNLTTAHPHLFVGAEVTVIYDGAIPSAVRVDWVYDDYFSLLLTADLGIDLDGDLMLTADETATLAKAVTDWPEGFEGDLEVKQGDTLIALGPRTDHRMTYAKGLVSETHVRPLQAATDAPLTVRIYDPFYYTAYELIGPVNIEGREDCTVTVTPPDLNRAYSLVEELLYGRPAADVGPDEQFPEVGVEFAETITVICGD